MPNYIIYAAIALVVLLIILLIFLIANLSGGKKAPAKKKYSSNSSGPIQLVHIQSIELPKQVESISKREIPSVVSKIFRVYEKLDYKTNVREFTKAQWHTWQVSLMLKMYKSGQDMFIPNPEAVFPEELTTKSDKDLRQIMNDILNKYKRDVEPHRNRDFLSRDIIWSGRDVAIIFYFLSRYQSFPKDLR